MAIEFIRHFDPTAVGSGDGTTQANAYTTLAALLSAEQKDIVTADEDMIILMHSGEDLGASNLTVSSSWITDPTHRVIFRSAAGLHTITSSNGTRTVRSYTNFVHSEGVNILNSANASAIQFTSITGAGGFQIEGARADHIYPQGFDTTSVGGYIRGINAVISEINSYTAYTTLNGFDIELINSIVDEPLRFDDNTRITLKNSALTNADAFLNQAGGGLYEIHATNSRFTEAVPETLTTNDNNQVGVDFTGVFTDSANDDYSLIGTPALMQSGIGPSLDADIPTTDYEGDVRAGAVTYIGIDEVIDNTDPVFSTPPAGSNETSVGFRVSATLNESGSAQALVTAQGSGQPGDVAFDASTDTATATAATNFDFDIDIVGQSASTTYTVWVRGLDNSANAVYASVDITTIAAHPVIGAVSTPIADGEVLTIDGSFLDLATAVTIGGVNQFANIVAQSASQITLTFSRGNIANSTQTVQVTDGVVPSNGSTTVGPISGYVATTINTPVTDNTSILFNFNGTPVNGDVVEAPTALSVNANGTFDTDALGDYTVNYYDGSTWTSAVVTVASGVVIVSGNYTDLIVGEMTYSIQTDIVR